jgi:hypothetical protein
MNKLPQIRFDLKPTTPQTAKPASLTGHRPPRLSMLTATMKRRALKKKPCKVSPTAG